MKNIMINIMENKVQINNECIIIDTKINKKIKKINKRKKIDTHR